MLIQKESSELEAMTQSDKRRSENPLVPLIEEGDDYEDGMQRMSMRNSVQDGALVDSLNDMNGHSLER